MVRRGLRSERGGGGEGIIRGIVVKVITYDKGGEMEEKVIVTTTHKLEGD